ncbi:[FeFe] hydrogenase, group A [Pelosinus fermentans]|uniref:[FeFe] hydrogenase, group A n=1 Tax=Pelosinus fermentans TaxID=365349 RepID=UPI0002685FB9|nr:[FeFe] hydrogenase, group A [Pelosinus fermentans]OAM92896.1 hydrogenase, Fe-only [Pelosinus fermentans DSM 17108]SDQ60272.1 [FeFe] hydrogenase, group A [Pelosinus fermentans]
MRIFTRKGTVLSRRKFFKLLGGMGLTGAVASISGCSTDAVGGKGWIPGQYQVPGNWPVKVKGRIPIDPANPSIVRDDQKCILCGQCLDVCEKVQTVYGYYELPIKKDITCVNCGQCALWCPTSSIREREDLQSVLRVLEDPNLHIVIQTAPATRVSLGEEFGLPTGSIVEGQQVAALKLLGFDAVFDTNFSADVTIMEEATELLKRLDKGNALPQFTSCCPGWVKFCEYYYPDLLPHLSSVKSPQQILGVLAKTYYSERVGIAPENIVSVAVMPCTAKKFECQRPEMNAAGRKAGNPQIRDVDFILTTRELARLMKLRKIDLSGLESAAYDHLMGESSGAGVIFGATGGVMEAAVRSLYFLVSKQRPPEQLLKFDAVRGLGGVKEAEVMIPGKGSLKVAVCHGLKNARMILEKVRGDNSPWSFIEFMGCVGGCIGGGGQPRTSLASADEVRQARIAGLYSLDDRIYRKRASFENQKVQTLYKEYLGNPGSDLAETLLHTHYVDRAKDVTIRKK